MGRIPQAGRKNDPDFIKVQSELETDMGGMRRLLWVIILVALQALLMWGTLYVPGFGEAIWHYAASLVLTLLVAALVWRPMSRSRRLLALGVLAFTVLATASGFWLLYWKEGLRADGLQDWGRSWHVLWSWFALVFFFQHTWINRVAYLHYLRKTLATIPAASIHILLYVLVVVAFFVTWSVPGRSWFTNDNYIPLSFYAWLVAAVPPYALWLFVNGARRSAGRFATMSRFFALDRMRRWVTVALVPLAALAIVSGIPLTFFDGPLGAAGFKYVSKYWHVWPSVAFAVLVFIHTIHRWPAVQAHWRSYGVSMGDVAGPARPQARDDPAESPLRTPPA